MFLLLIALSCPAAHGNAQAHADTIHLPVEMREKVDAAREALSDGARATKRSAREASERSDLAKAALTDLGKIWSGMKTQSRHALLFLDQQLHEHVLGADREREAR